MFAVPQSHHQIQQGRLPQLWSTWAETPPVNREGAAVCDQCPAKKIIVFTEHCEGLQAKMTHGDHGFSSLYHVGNDTVCDDQQHEVLRAICHLWRAPEDLQS